MDLLSFTVYPQESQELINELQNLSLDELEKLTLEACKDLDYKNFPFEDKFKTKDDHIDFLVGYHAVQKAIEREYGNLELGVVTE